MVFNKTFYNNGLINGTKKQLIYEYKCTTYSIVQAWHAFLDPKTVVKLSNTYEVDISSIIEG